MGREIRKVPREWEHPKDERGIYIPLFDQTYEEAVKEWKENYADEDEKPEPEWHRPEYESEPTCFQVYEDVTEGTPISPVFETLEELIQWLVKEGYSEHAARKFAKERWAPSMLVHNGNIWMDINSYDVLD